MKTRYLALLILAALVFSGALVLTGQQQNRDIAGVITQGDRPAIAISDFRGAGDAQKFMNAFNEVLWNEISGSGVLRMAAKAMYPLQVPQQPSDFKPPSTVAGAKRGDPPRTVSNGPWLTDWSGPPVSANYLAFGYTGVQDGRLTLFGWLYNVGQPDPQSAQVFFSRYFADLSEAGAIKLARDFAADILKQFGAQSLAGTKIIFVSDRTGAKEIWSMDYDGKNQRQITSYRSTSNMPVASPDGRLVAFTTYAGGNPQIRVHSLETGRRANFYNPVSSMVATPEFTPDGKRILFSATIDKFPQLFSANIDGGQLERLSNVRAIEVSPRVNPKTGREILFISGRSGRQQLYRMNSEGGDIERRTTGEGDVANPSWRPDGQFIAFAWTRGYEPGNFNIFIMDIAKREPIQLTHGVGRNENPWWAPDGNHIVFSAKRGAGTQIYTMLADGSNVQQLTTQGNNLQPVWAMGTN
jgi:TolB protein